MSPPEAESSVELSVIVLCYRAEEKVFTISEQLAGILDRLCDEWEMVLVGNYLEDSADRTKEVVQQLATQHPRMKAVARPKEGMMGWDARSGFRAATGRYLCLIDGDGQFPMESIERCYREIHDEDLDLVMTYRTSRHDGTVRGMLSTIYNGVFRLLFPGLSCRDVNSKPKILSRSAYETMQLESDDWFIDAEIMIKVRRHGMRFRQLPTVFSKLEGRPSFVRLATVFEFIRNLILYRIREFGR